MHELDALILKHGAQGFEKQVHFADIIGDTMPAWQLDVSNGTLHLGEVTFGMQLLGTEAEATETWLWAWANEQSNLPDAVLKIANQMRDYGEENSIEALTKSTTIPVDDPVSGHRFGLLASALFGADAYFRAPYEGGAAFLSLKDDDFPADDRHPILRITSTFPQFIQSMRIFDHQTALQSYANYHNLKTALTREEGIVTLTAKHPDGSSLTAQFDARDRLTQLQSNIVGDSQ
ncbi:MAG: DUF6882 domain-containing protein [Chloroflexota bacterium]